MAKPYIPREKVHAWSEEIGENSGEHRAAMTRLLKQQRRLTRFVEENAEHMNPGTAGVGVYMFGVISRIFDLAGGDLRAATWEQVREAEKKVGAAAAELLPVDDGFGERVRQVEWRAQPHILDEAYMALFESAPGEEEVEVDQQEAAKIFFLMWVATEVLDQNWKPAKDFEGETTYTHVPIAPKRPKKEAAAE